MGYGYYKGFDTYLFGISQAFYPALGVMVAILMTKKQMPVPESFFVTYILITVAMIIVTAGSVVLPENSRIRIPFQIIILLTFVLGCTALAQKEEIAKLYGIKGGDLKKSILVIILFIIMYFTVLLVSCAINGEIGYFIKILAKPGTWFGMVGLIPFFFISFIPYFGEEYGWRFYLQPILQKKLGKRKGVIVLGIIWGIWHLPVCYFYYGTPDDGITVILIQIVACISIGIFFAYAYMKTRSIWAVTFLHYFNNSMAAVLDTDFSKTYGSGWEGLASGTVVYAIFLTVLLSKTFKEDKYTLPTLEDRMKQLKL